MQILITLLVLFLWPPPATMNCRILEGKVAVEIGTATTEEIDRGDIPVRCVMANSTVDYRTIPYDEYEWRGCRDEFKLPEKFFAKLQDAVFITDKCEIHQRRECSAAEMASAVCGERLPLGVVPCRAPR